MSFGTGVVSNRKNATDTSTDVDAMERENERELEELSSKAAYLKEITTGIKDDVEAQNLLLNSVDDHMGSVQGGLSGVVNRFRKTMETPDGRKRMGIIAVMIVVMLIILVLVMK